MDSMHTHTLKIVKKICHKNLSKRKMDKSNIRKDAGLSKHGFCNIMLFIGLASKSTNSER